VTREERLYGLFEMARVSKRWVLIGPPVRGRKRAARMYRSVLVARPFGANSRERRLRPVAEPRPEDGHQI
jgi:hypothetical protein